MTSILQEQIQNCENFIILVLKKIISNNQWNLDQINTFEEKKDILRLYLNWTNPDLWNLKRQFVSLWIHWYINATQLDWKIKRLIFYFVLLNKKDPFVFIEYFEYFRENHSEKFETYVFDTLLYWLLNTDKPELKYTNWNLEEISFKNNIYFKRNQNQIDNWLFSYYEILKDIIKNSYEYTDQQKRNWEKHLQIWYERIYFIDFEFIWLNNQLLSNLINFSNQNESLFKWTTTLNSFRYEIDENIYQNDEIDNERNYENDDEDFEWVNQEEVKKEYHYLFSFDYDLSKHYDLQCKEFFEKHYQWMFKYYQLVQKSLEFEDWIITLRKQERKIQTTILSLIQLFWLFWKTNELFENDSKYKEETKQLINMFLYFITLLNILQSVWEEEICIEKEIWMNYKIWFVLWHTDISKKNTIKTIENKDEFNKITWNYILSELFWYTEDRWNRIDVTKSILWFSKKWIKWWNITVFKNFLSCVPKIQDITLNNVEYHHKKNVDEIKKLYLSDIFQIVYTVDHKWELKHLIKFDSWYEKKWFLWLTTKKVSSIEEIYELWNKEKQKMFSSNVIQTPIKFIFIQKNLFYLPYLYHNFHSKSLNYWIQQLVLYRVIKHILSKCYWLPLQYLIITKHDWSWTDDFKWPFNISNINFEFQTILSKEISEQLKKDWIFENINLSWSSIQWSLKVN